MLRRPGAPSPAATALAVRPFAASRRAQPKRPVLLAVDKKLDGTRHDAELMEAKALAAHRWHRLLDLEQQVVREEQKLAGRPRTRPNEPGDDLVPNRTLAERDRAWEEQTKDRRDSLGALKEQAKAERKELEGYVVKEK